MKMISEYIDQVLDIYYLDTENQSVYNQDLDDWIEPDQKYIVRLKTKEGKRKGYSMATLYRLCDEGIFCNDTTKSLEGEIWKEIPDTQGFYLASNKGRIKSLKGNQAKILKGTKNKAGYTRVDIRYTNAKGEHIRKTKFLHILVAETFLGKQPGTDYQCHHIDKNKDNSQVDNLEWLNKSEHRKKHSYS